MPPITADERERWQLDADNLPLGSEERDRCLRDPTAYYLQERLQDASAELGAALNEHVNATGMLLLGPTPPALSLEAARDRVNQAQRRWAKTSRRAEKLLGERDCESGQGDVFTLTDQQLDLLRELLFLELRGTAQSLAEQASVAAEGSSDSLIASRDAEGQVRLRLRVAADLLDLLGWSVRVGNGGR